MPQYAVIYISLVHQFEPAIPEVFFCEAADADYAEALCLQSNPGARLIHVAEGLDRHERDTALHAALCETLEIGDPVCWYGPDDDPRSGICIFHGSSGDGPTVRLESFADWVDVPASQVAVAPARPEERLARMQELASEYLGLAQQVVDAAAGRGDPDSRAGELLATFSDAEQQLSEIGIADLDCGAVPAGETDSRAA